MTDPLHPLPPPDRRPPQQWLLPALSITATLVGMLELILALDAASRGKTYLPALIIGLLFFAAAAASVWRFRRHRRRRRR